ncbi:MAG: 4Fe-4S dicluster domain-containing protein, partial [Gemmobacter sp.]
SVGQPTLSRRHFFATLRRGAPAIAAIRARSADRRTQAACRPSATVAQHQREHSQALHALAAHVGQPLTAQALPRVVAHDNCQLDGLCAAACPSGALRLVESEDGSQAGLDFDAATCLGCGLCARLCPHAALSVHTAGEANQALGSGPEPLIRRVQQRCATCGTAWVP